MKIFKKKAKQEKSILDRKCFVNVDKNLPEFTVGQDRWPAVEIGNGSYGPILPLMTTLETKNASKKFVSKWMVTPDANNSDPALSNDQPAALEAGEVDEIKLEGGKRGFKNMLTMPNSGGDRYQVVCTKANQQNPRVILECNVETWRGLWFTVFWTDHSHPTLINQMIDMVKKEYRNVFIDINHVPAQHKLNWDHDFTALISNRNDNNEDFLKAMHGGQMPVLQRNPFHFQIVLVKYCAKLDTTILKIKIDPNRMKGEAYEMDFSGNLKIILPKSGNTLLDAHMVDQVARLRPNFKFCNSFKSIKYRVEMTPEQLDTINQERLRKLEEKKSKAAETKDTAADSKDTEEKAAVASVPETENKADDQKDKTTVETKTAPETDEISDDEKPIDPSKLSGTITPTADNVKYLNQWHFSLNPTGVFDDFLVKLDKPVPVEIEFEIEIADHTVAGQNYRNVAVLGTQKTPVEMSSPAEFGKIMIHEIGHALGLVPVGHPDHYTGHGGVGPHCKFNTVLKEEVYVHGGGKMCVMYHQIHPEAGPGFCANCMKYLKMTKLSSYYLKTMRGWE